MMDDDIEETQNEEQEQQGGEPGEEALGDAGKRALDAMKAKWRTARDELAALKREKEREAEGKEGDKPDVEKIRERAALEARTELLRERVLDKIEAKAAKLFADPEDAVALLARRSEEFISDGRVDTDEIMEALSDLIKRKPHLAATAPPRFAGSADGGARKGSKPDQLTRDDLKRMTPQQIVKAQDEGRLNDMLGVD
jgi:hypothetical protein